MYKVRRLSYNDFDAAPLSCLMYERMVMFDVYMAQNDTFTLLVAAGSKIGKDAVNKLYAGGIRDIFIPKAQKGKFNDYLKKHLSFLTQSQSVTIEDKARMIYSSTQETMRNLFNNPESKEALDESKAMATQIMDKILTEPKAFLSLLQITSFDYYTYTHSINVSIYSIGIAKYLKLPEAEIENIAKASILHDLGKSKISDAIVNKPGVLTEEEFSVMKMHPIYGYDILRSHGENSDDVLSAVRGHHEKQDGTGYPDKLTKDEISFNAQLIAVADIFDALTTRRSYKEALHTYTALRLMRDRMKAHINKDIFTAFAHCMHGELN